MAPRIYVASPLGFTVPTRQFYGDVLLRAIQEVGLEALDPWAAGEAIVAALVIDDPHERREALQRANTEVGLHNEQLLGESRGVFAVLDGPDVDSGTAAEIGWASARGLPIVGWRSDIRLTGDNEASIVNLQVEYFIERSGGTITRDLHDALTRLRVLVGNDA